MVIFLVFCLIYYIRQDSVIRLASDDPFHTTKQQDISKDSTLILSEFIVNFELLENRRGEGARSRAICQNPDAQTGKYILVS